MSQNQYPTLKNLLKINFPWIVRSNSNQNLSIGLCIRLAWSLLFLSNWTPRILTSMTSSPGLLNDTCDGALAIRFIIGRDFSVTRSSPESCWDRFAIATVQTVELKWLILNKVNKWFHSSRVKFPLVNVSARWFSVSMYLIWILESRSFDQITNQEQLCGFWRRVSLWGFFPSWSSWSLLRCLQRYAKNLLIRRLDVWGNTINIFQRVGLPWRSLTSVNDNGSSRFLCSLSHASQTETTRSHNSRTGSPSNLNPACKKMISDSYTSNLMEHVYDFQKCTMSHQMWILNLQDLPQSQSLETVPVCIVWQCCPHSKIVCIHMCDEYVKSIDSGVCHRPWSILWWILQACSLTIEHRVFQCVPSIGIQEQFKSIRVTILQQISFLLLWSGAHRCMEQILCRVVESFCLPTHNIVPHTSLHGQPCHRTTKKTHIFRVWWFFSCSFGNSGFTHGSVIVHNIFVCVALSLSASHILMIQKRCWFSQIDFVVEYLPHRINIVFLSN